MMAVVWALAADARAWTYRVCPAVPSGTSLTWHLSDLDGDWSSGEEDDIEDAADQWDGGSGLRNRGVDWNMVRGTDVVAVVVNNGLNEVGDAPWSTFELAGYAPATRGTTITTTSGGCTVWEEADILVMDEDALPPGYSFYYSAGDPSTLDLAVSQPIQAIMLHEFGHMLGLGEVSGGIAAVMKHYPAAELGGLMRIHEDDYVGLKALHPGSSTGKNFLLGKWVSASSSLVREAWDDDVDTWTGLACPGVPFGLDFPAGAVPEAPYLVVNGTSTSGYTVKVEWSLSGDHICFDDDDVIVGVNEEVTVTSNLPYLVEPDGNELLVPLGTADGTYGLCVGVNLGVGALSETDTADNVVRSQRELEVDAGACDD